MSLEICRGSWLPLDSTFLCPCTRSSCLCLPLYFTFFYFPHKLLSLLLILFPSSSSSLSIKRGSHLSPIPTFLPPPPLGQILDCLISSPILFRLALCVPRDLDEAFTGSYFKSPYICPILPTLPAPFFQLRRPGISPFFHPPLQSSFDNF